MRLTEVEKFFRDLDSRLDYPVRVILTGGAAAVVYGVERVTEDIDFEIHALASTNKRRHTWQELEEKLAEAARATRITPEYSEDIDRWSSIAMPGKKSKVWQRIGKVEVRVLDPGLWAIGKLSRFLFTDQSDLVAVLNKSKTTPEKLVELWGNALGISPGSSAISLFKKNVEVFLSTYARKVWGEKTDPNKLMEIFLKKARATTRA